MPTEHSSPVSRRKLGIFGVVAGVAAVLLVITGIRAREDSSAQAARMDRQSGNPDGRGGDA